MRLSFGLLAFLVIGALAIWPVHSPAQEAEDEHELDASGNAFAEMRFFKPNQKDWKLVRKPKEWLPSKTNSRSADGKSWFRGLGSFEKQSTSAYAISDDGQTIVGSSHFAVRWKLNGEELDVSVVAPRVAGFEFVSADGSMMAGQMALLHAFYWTEKTGIRELGYLPDAGEKRSSVVRFVSPDGKLMMGHARSAKGLVPFRWTAAEGMMPLEGLGDRANLYMGGASADGEVAVLHSTETREAFRWTRKKGLESLGFSVADEPLTEVGISADGKVIFASKSFLGLHAIRWTEAGKVQFLGDLPGGRLWAQPRSSSKDGAIIVGDGHTEKGLESFVWDAANGMRNLSTLMTEKFGLDLKGWREMEIHGMTPDARYLVGTGISPDARYEAWAARIQLP